jgi:hypothetical protein
MASFVWMLLTEPSYKPNTLTAQSLAGEESKPEDLPEGTRFPKLAAGSSRRAPFMAVQKPYSGNAAVAFLLVFFATFPFENQSPEDADKGDWLIGIALVLFVLALVTTLTILLSRLRWAVAACVAAAGSGVALLVWALDVSEHSDGKLVVWGTVIELVGLGAVALARRAQAASEVRAK